MRDRYRRDRIKACELAAQVFAGQNPEMPRLWSMVVFFEAYIQQGSKGTLKNFGPKKPAKLKAVQP